MRYLSLLAGLPLLLISSARLIAADKAPDVRTVIVPRAQVWCGPSTANGLYPTNVLRQGERVQVVQEFDSGWLAIRPPAGSFSWINERFVQHTVAKYPDNYVVNREDYPAPVLIGSSEVKVKPTRIGTKLERGTQVRVIGRAMKDDEGTWLPIEAPEGELRYIRKEDVSKPSPPASALVTTAASVRKEPPPPPDGDALWRDADRAERTGHLADAIRLYRQAGDANLSVNPARAEEAYRRARWLEQANTSTNPPGGSSFVPDRGAATYPVPPNQAGTNAVRLIGTASPGAVNGQLVSASASSTNWMEPRPNDYVRGHLSKPSRSLADRPGYWVMDDSEKPLIYVTAAPGVDLSSHIHQKVDLWGSSVYIKDLRRRLMTVTSVQPVP
ncbi:MAG TPA: hypothetical protein VH575_21230 [Gemmataceae bacterium]|jgi:hypothetical protein